MERRVLSRNEVQYQSCRFRLRTNLYSFSSNFPVPTDDVGEMGLIRKQGRSDDNIETIRKRFKVFNEQTLPVIKHYETIATVHKVETECCKTDIAFCVSKSWMVFNHENARCVAD